MSKQKIALITGGSRGLGRNMALAIAKKGMDVDLTYNRNKEKADEVVKEIHALGKEALAFQLDTRNVHSYDDFVQSLTKTLEEKTGSSKFDFLINNAGTALYAPIPAVTEAQLDDIFNIHFKGVFFLTQKSLPFINEGGAIINVSSGLARMTLPGSSVYAAAKSAVETFTRYLAKELGDRKIRANAIAPGAVETDFGGGRTRDNKEVNALIASNTALGRAGLPDDIGGVVAFLCSEEAYWINGQRIEVSGGQML